LEPEPRITKNDGRVSAWCQFHNWPGTLSQQHGPFLFFRADTLGTVNQLCYNPHPRGETTLANLSGIVKQLKKERDRVQHQLSGLNAALAAFARVYRGNAGTKPRRKLSAQGRARIAAAQRARWAKVNGQRKVVPITKPKRTMSASARRKIAAAQRARWAKVKRDKKAA